MTMRSSLYAIPAIALAAVLALPACREEPAAEPTAPSRPSSGAVAAKAADTPRERAVRAVMEE